RKFKQCCASADVPPPPAPPTSTGEALFFDYMAIVKGAMIFYGVVCHEKDGRWLRKENAEFERRFRPGAPDGAPDSLHTGWLLFDLRLPSSGETAGQQFLARHGAGLNEPGPTHLRQLCQSYVTFHEVV